MTATFDDSQAPPFDEQPTGDKPASPLLPILLGLSIALTLVLSGCSSTSLPKAATHPAVGRSLELETVPALLHVEGDLQPSDYADKVTLVHYWGTWCVPCLREYPEIVGLYRSQQDNPDFKLVSVSCSRGPDSIEEIRATTAEYYQQANAEIPTYADATGDTFVPIVKTLDERAMVFPTTIVLDRTGTIRGVWRGYSQLGVSEMSDMVNALLAESPAAG